MQRETSCELRRKMPSFYAQESQHPSFASRASVLNHQSAFNVSRALVDTSLKVPSDRARRHSSELPRVSRQLDEYVRNSQQRIGSGMTVFSEASMDFNVRASITLGMYASPSLNALLLRDKYSINFHNRHIGPGPAIAGTLFSP